MLWVLFPPHYGQVPFSSLRAVSSDGPVSPLITSPPDPSLHFFGILLFDKLRVLVSKKGFLILPSHTKPPAHGILWRNL